MGESPAGTQLLCFATTSSEGLLDHTRCGVGFWGFLPPQPDGVAESGPENVLIRSEVYIELASKLGLLQMSSGEPVVA